MRAFSVVAISTAAYAAVPADLVTSLPGFSGALPSKLYSGYLQGGAGKMAHYAYSESLNAPSSDPILLWFNGGPGCSSMEGMMR